MQQHPKILTGSPKSSPGCDWVVYEERIADRARLQKYVNGQHEGVAMLMAALKYGELTGVAKTKKGEPVR